MTTFRDSPQVFKGALVTIDPVNSHRSVIAFQFNPHTMTRRLEPSATGGEGGGKGEALRLAGPPKETITLSVEFDAADQLENDNRLAHDLGVYSALSALEMLLYPTSKHVVENTALARAGNIEIIPPKAPLTLLSWGPKRMLPIRLTGFSVTEEVYDRTLNPIRAKVDLTLEVLSYADFTADELGYEAFMTYQRSREG